MATPKITFFVVRRSDIRSANVYRANPKTGPAWTLDHAERMTFSSYRAALLVVEKHGGMVATDPHPWNAKPVGKVA